MSTSTDETAVAQNVTVTTDELIVELADGRTLAVPLAWYPRLEHGSRKERNHWELLGRGIGIHWPELDEDIGVDGLLAGRRSGESASSLRKWLAGRRPASRSTARQTVAPRKRKPAQSRG